MHQRAASNPATALPGLSAESFGALTWADLGLPSGDPPGRPRAEPRRTLATLLADTHPFAPLPAGTDPHPLAQAAAAPDVFLLAAADPLAAAADIASRALRAGERVAVLTADPVDADKVLNRLTDCHPVRALGAGEMANQFARSQRHSNRPGAGRRRRRRCPHANPCPVDAPRHAAAGHSGTRPGRRPGASGTGRPTGGRRGWPGVGAEYRGRYPVCPGPGGHCATGTQQRWPPPTRPSRRPRRQWPFAGPSGTRSSVRRPSRPGSASRPDYSGPLNICFTGPTPRRGPAPVPMADALADAVAAAEADLADAADRREALAAAHAVEAAAGLDSERAPPPGRPGRSPRRSRRAPSGPCRQPGRRRIWR